ncbi:MAG TPA: helix-turn-helix domain-containing protein [Bryobacteraceae bacterium]|jgi:transposase|nr:helix-turn-helix domain-containing protein [Bryobacteraceae bacterium]
MEKLGTWEQTPLVQPALTPTDAELTRRRDAAVAMAIEGFTQNHIAKKLNVSQPTVCRWLRGTQRTGIPKSRVLKPEEAEAVGEKPPIGRAPFLSFKQLREIQAQWPGHRWTGREFQTAIFNSFGLRYSPGYCCVLLAYLRSENSGATRFDIGRLSPDGCAADLVG